MEMKSNLVLHRTKFKIFVKIIKTNSFRNPENQSHDQARGFKKKTTKVRTSTEGSFRNQELENTDVLVI
jgi:hypothetical protein